MADGQTNKSRHAILHSFYLLSAKEEQNLIKSNLSF